MVCKKYQELSTFERYEYIGKIVHLFMCDDETFELGCELINKAQSDGKLDRVKILPEGECVS